MHYAMDASCVVTYVTLILACPVIVSRGYAFANNCMTNV